MVDILELQSEQAYFDRAWDWREAAREAATSASNEGGRHDVKAYVAQNRSYAEELADPDVEVAHGSITLDDGEVVYIGRNSIHDENRDLLVVNWRTKIAELYERATAQDPCGVSRKRTFRTERNTITSFEDTLFAELAAKVAELSELELSGVDDALLDDLDVGRTGAMRDIVRTIQASQSSLIRHPADALLVIQGGPGTGKSAVALHRVSWLLFNEPGLQAERVLIVGPSETFKNYIKEVLPGLGDEHVPQISLRQLGPQKSTRREENAETARIKGEARMRGLIQRALHLRIRVPSPDIVIGRGVNAVEIPSREVRHQVETLRGMPTYVAGRSGLRSWLYNRAAQERVRRSPFLREVDIDASAIDAVVERIWPQLSPQQFVRELLGSQARLQEAAGDAFTAREIGLLYRQAAATVAAETWSDSDVALLDEAEYRLRGVSDRYDHIVVDEAQDLSPMQLRSLRRRSANGSFTIVGDIAQSTGPWARDSWDAVIRSLAGNAPVVYRELDYGYRVPAEIYEVAARLLPMVAPGVEPLTVVRPAPEPPRFILDDGDYDLRDETIEAIKEHAVKGRFLGVVVAPEAKEALARALQDEGINFADADKGSLGSSVNLISATEAKGLEFDAVVVVEPAAIAEVGERGMRLLYIALTRATKYLTVVHARAFEPLGLEGAAPLPDPDLSFTDQLFLEAAQEASSLEGTVTPVAPAPTHRRDGTEQTELFEVAPVVARDLRPSAASPVSPLLRAAAKGLADQIRDEVQPEKWASLVAEIARELGVDD